MHPSTLVSEFSLPTLQGFGLATPDRLYWLLLVAAALGFWLWQVGDFRHWPAPIIRALVLALFVLAWAGPRSISHSEGVTRPVLIDASASITPAMRNYVVGLLRDELKLHDRDPAIMFASNPVDSTIGAASSALTSPAGCAGCGPGATNLETALSALATNDAAHQGPIALITDGWENRGNADAVLRSLSAAGIRLYIFTPPGARDVPNIAMTQLSLPPALQKAEPFALGVSLMNLNATPAAGTVSLYRNGTLIDQREVTLAPGQTRVDFPVRAEVAGLASYRAIFKAHNPALDTYPEDNSLEGWVGVGAQRKVLILTDTARDASYLNTAVRQLGMQPSTVTLSGSDEHINPQGYDVVILNNVARARLSPATQDALVRYVAAGGSLAMVGGDQSFGLGGYANTPIAKIMPVVMKPPEHHERKRALILSDRQIRIDGPQQQARVCEGRGAHRHENHEGFRSDRGDWFRLAAF